MDDNKQYKNSSSHDRRVKAYLKPNLSNWFKTYASERGLSESQALNEAVELLKSTIKKPSKNSY